MKREWIAAERVEEVRASAEGWKRAGAIDSGTFEEISRRYPEPRPLPSPLWRALVFVFVSLALVLLLGAFAFGARGSTGALTVLLLVFGAVSLVAAEAQESAPRLALRGGAGATSFWGIVFFLAGVFLFLEEASKVRVGGSLTLLLLAAFASWALAAWRWGNPVYAVLAAISLFLLLARGPSGRLLWVACGAMMAFAFGGVLDRPSWAPSHRRCAEALVACGLLGTYAAVNLYALDHRLVESIRGVRLTPLEPDFFQRISAMAGTAVVSVAVLSWGIRSRRAFVIDTGVVLTALSLLTLRFYVHIAPLWVLLIAAGAALVLLALALNRWLARGTQSERKGFTAESLFDMEEWIWLYQHFGYTGDYEFIYFE